jgi:ring-1,2-phenylacetyl-CoA epoxidase subunit PaaC
MSEAFLDDDATSERWAFGTGFIDPLQGIEIQAPPGPDAPDLVTRCLMLGDDALIYSHRLQQWIARLPELEEETAVANIALDLLGQARLLLSRAGYAEGMGRDEDRLAFFRLEHEFRNVRLVERADGDFADLVARLLVFSTWRLALLGRLRASADPALAAIAARGTTELAYHRDYAAGWVIRLGDGTAVSRDRMRAGLETIWPYVDELFLPDAVLAEADELVALRAEVDATIETVLTRATLERPDQPPTARVRGATGRDGVHTEALGHILAEMQSVARAHPQGTW